MITGGILMFHPDREALDRQIAAVRPWLVLVRPRFLPSQERVALHFGTRPLWQAEGDECITGLMRFT